MRRLVAWDLMTLDGYFEGRNPWDLGFHETVWGDELEAFSLEQGKEIGTLLFGRRTYEGMAGYWSQETGAIADMMNSIDKAVATRTLDEATWNNTRLLKGEAAEAVRALKAEEGKDVYVFGSADLLELSPQGRARRRIPDLRRAGGAGRRQSALQAAGPAGQDAPRKRAPAQDRRGDPDLCSGRVANGQRQVGLGIRVGDVQNPCSESPFRTPSLPACPVWGLGPILM